jgi:hypothetical protein
MRQNANAHSDWDIFEAGRTPVTVLHRGRTNEEQTLLLTADCHKR